MEIEKIIQQEIKEYSDLLLEVTNREVRIKKLVGELLNCNTVEVYSGQKVIVVYFVELTNKDIELFEKFCDTYTITVSMDSDLRVEFFMGD